MARKRDLSMMSLKKALHARLESGIQKWESLCVFDLANSLGVDIWFKALSSAEGFYSYDPERPVIIISSLRPYGRQAFTCAHELGHHLFNHGTKLDEITIGQSSFYNEEEFLADQFAAYLLMPKTAIQRYFFEKGIPLNSIKPTDILVASFWFGVGYQTLIHHMEKSLSLIVPSMSQTLLRSKPSSIRRELIGKPIDKLLLVERKWGRRPVDIEKGTLVGFHEEIKSLIDGVVCKEKASGYNLYLFEKKGCYDVQLNDGSFRKIRVFDERYEGRYVYRYMGEPRD